MARYLCGRILSAVLTVFFVTVVLYILLSLLQGTPPGASKVPPLLQYGAWLRDVLHGNLGTSERYGAPVLEIIAQRFAPSALLAGTGLLWATLLGLPIGVMAAYKPASVWDRISSVFALAGFTTPCFILCIASIYLFSFRLRLTPAMGIHSVGNASLGDLFHHLILPAAIIAVSVMGYLIKQTRSACLEVFQEDYLKTARAKGLSEINVVIRHGLRTALAPILTQMILTIPEVISAAAITEKIFGWPGIGALMIDAIRNRDTPLIMGEALIMVAVVLVSNILLDIAYVLLDPRAAEN